MIFQKSLIKSLIHKIKKYKKFQNFLTSIDNETEKKISKIITE